jgi:hypothetical protein
MMWHWKGLVAGALGVAFIVGVSLHDLFPERVASAARAVVIVACVLPGVAFLLMFIIAYTIPLFTLATKGQKAAEHEWRRYWWIK